jgi:guanylate kinase
MMKKKKKKGKLVVITAPSGTGKSSLIKHVRERYPHVRESVSFTSRPMRPGEKEGVDYYYIDKKKFEQKISDGDFLEWALVHGDYKGTDAKQIQKYLQEGVHMLFDLDVQGADAIRKMFNDDARIIFIEPPSFEELEKRLRGRNTETEEKIQMRLENARKELKRKNDYDHLITNDEIEKALERLTKIINDIIGQ